MSSTSMPRVLRNAGSVLTSDVMNRATTFVLYALVARYLGAFELGQMSLALTLFYVAQVLAAAGLKTLITREVARDQTRADAYLVHGSLIVIAASLGSMVATLVFVRAMGYSDDTARIILTLSVALLPYSLSAVCEGIFQAREDMHCIVYANAPANLARMIGAVVLLSQGHGLIEVVILTVGCHLAIVVGEWLLLIRRVGWPAFRFEPGFALAIVRSTGTFFGIDGVVAIFGTVEILLLSKMASETEVGLFSAANQLLVPIGLVCQSLVLSLFPMMCRRFEASGQRLKPVAENLIGLLLAIGLPTAVGLSLLAERVLLLLYADDSFLAAAPVLRILAWGLVIRALTIVLGHVLYAGRRERVTLRIVTVDALAGLTFGFVLISQFGLIGAAVAALLTRMVDLVQHLVPVSRLLSGIAPGRLAYHALIASACMAIYLVLAGAQDTATAVVSAGVLYTAVLIALAAWSAGGLRQLRAEYVQQWSD